MADDAAGPVPNLLTGQGLRAGARELHAIRAALLAPKVTTIPGLCGERLEMRSGVMPRELMLRVFWSGPPIYGKVTQKGQPT